jgi:predicted metal-dependent peptidase
MGALADRAKSADYFMRELTPRETVTEAIEALYSHWPLFANIASGFEIVEDKSGATTQTMATDGKRLYFCPDFVKDLSIAEAEWVVLHECGHCFLGHHLRLIGEDRMDRNVAFDLALNSLIRGFAPSDKLRAMMLAPGHGPFAELKADEDAETYFKAVSKGKQQDEQQQNSDSDKQSDESDESEQQQSAGDSQSDESEQSDSEQQGEGQGSDSSQESSADAQGSSESDEQTQGDSSEGSASQSASGRKAATPKPIVKAAVASMGEVLEHPAETAAEQAKAEGEWQQTIAESMAVAQQCGNLPGWLKALGEKLLGESKTDWRTILRRFLTKSIPVGTNYAVPSRRHSHRKDIIMPGRRTKGGGDGVIIADVSGSIFSIIRDTVVPEANKILRSLPKTSVRLMQVDTRVVADKTYNQYDLPLKVDIAGGGGTDLNPALLEASKARGKLKWQIIVTDMYWSWQTAHDAGIPTLWVVIGNSSFKGKPPFGEVVTVS